VAIIAAITIVHYSVSHTYIYIHDISRRLYYLPIILASYWFGKSGGIYSALTITLAYFPHALFYWYGKHPRYLDNMIEIVFFNVVGYMIGSYIEKKNEQRLSAEKTSRELKEAYQKLTQNTERVMQLEEELRFADRLALMGELSASFAHEIRNPLGGIQGAAEILSKAIPEQDQNREFVQIQLDEIKRLNQVVENYLSLSGPELKAFSAYNLVDIIISIRDLIQLSARQHHVDLVFNAHDKDGLWIYGDLIRLRQAFLNIALNGIHAMPEGGTLKFIVEPFPDDQKVRITVRDTGKGIPQSIREKIFDPFFSTREKGSGLGLTIARRIIEDHQGQITFESNEQGTAFFIGFPMHRVNSDG